LAYASGAAPEWLALMVSCHLTLCPSCRDEASWLDDLGAALMPQASVETDGRAPQAVPALEDLLAKHGSRVSAPSPPERFETELMRSVPRPLHAHFVDREPRMRRLVPGIRHAPLSVEGAAVRLLEFRKGFVIPEHAHSGLEWVLVLDGDVGCSLTGQRYRRGDVLRSETDSVHRLDVATDEPCIALIANLAPVVPCGRIPRT